MMKRGQSAIEFISTYGWALMVLLIMMGSLVYFGLFRPSAPTRCMISPEFGCLDYKVTKTDLSLRVKNNMNSPVNISNLNASTISQQGAFCTGFSATPSSIVKPEESSIIKCSIALTNLAVGEKYKLKFSFDYQKLETGIVFTKKVEGEMYAVLQ